MVTFLPLDVDVDDDVDEDDDRGHPMNRMMMTTAAAAMFDLVLVDRIMILDGPIMVVV